MENMISWDLEKICRMGARILPHSPQIINKYDDIEIIIQIQLKNTHIKNQCIAAICRYATKKNLTSYSIQFHSQLFSSLISEYLTATAPVNNFRTFLF